MADSLTCRWTGSSGDGKWTTAGNWTPSAASSVCPAGQYPGQTYPADSVRINLYTGTALLDTSTTIGVGSSGSLSGPALSTASGTTLNLVQGTDGSPTTLTLVRTNTYGMSIAGNLNLGASTGIVLQNDGTPNGEAWVNGGAVVTLSGGSIVQSGTAPMTLVNAGIIQGYGKVGDNTDLIISNYAAATTPTINANSSGNALIVDPAGDRNGTGFLNRGALQAGAASGDAATLRLVDGNFNNGVDRVGYIRAYDRGIVSIENSVVRDGTVAVLPGGQLRLSNSDIVQGGTYANGITISTGATVNAVSGTNSISGVRAGSSHSNSGLITATGGATLTLANTTFLNGGGTIKPDGGTIVLSNAVINNGTIDATSGQLQLNGATIGQQNSQPLAVRNGPGGGIVNTGGSSTVLVGGYNVTFENAAGGVIDAQAGTLTLNGGTGSTGPSNGGTIKASSGGTLVLQNRWGNVGSVVADAGGTVTLNNAVIGSGGTITVNPGATLSATGTSGSITGINLVQNGTFTVTPGGRLDVAGAAGMAYTQGAGAQTVLDGVLRSTGGNLSISGGTVTVNSGGGLAGNGTGSVTTNATVMVNSGGQINAPTYTLSGGTLTISGTATATTQFNQNAGAITINSGGALTAQGSFSQAAGASIAVNGTMTVGSATGGTRIFTQSGDVTVGSGGVANIRTYNQTGGALVVDGRLTTNGPFTQSGGTATVNGTLNPITATHSGGDLTVNGTLSTTSGSGTVSFTQSGGNLSVAGTGSLYASRGYTQSGGYADIDGRLSVGTYGSIAINGGVLEGSGTLAGSVTVANGGRLQGTPTINGALTIGNGGTLAIGNSPGIENVTGNYTQAAGSTWEVEIQGIDPGLGYDQLNVTGNVTLAGILRMILGYDPVMPSNYQILTYTGTLSGDWTQILLVDTAGVNYAGPWHLNRTAGAISLQLDNPVPEPGTLGLLGLALVGLGVVMRRRQRVCLNPRGAAV